MVSLEVAEALHNQHRPSTPYLPGGRLEHYHVGPIPFGTTRQALTKIFAYCPLGMASQTSAPNPEGSRRFGLCLAHPSTPRAQSSVWSLAHGDVIITKAKTATGTRQDRTQQTLMGRKTKEALVEGAHGTSQTARDP